MVGDRKLLVAAFCGMVSSVLARRRLNVLCLKLIVNTISSRESVGVDGPDSPSLPVVETDERLNREKNDVVELFRDRERTDAAEESTESDRDGENGTAIE
ncbi:hypothetical protein LIPSTDRAFT_76700 [Lipomyces starkeyi NRRL Y-11557]|uniref:Uncharacterized protein n=1 Tax=Lipomyces starkeyi NRRL Y-11557 TaxID=675824 RepID=A0A1E3PTS3_LIPST|nr:hypothetical protein LIPSTDRAFT_76700 [Lipomyces starkeyi NRRL Y-11557]